uniref:ShTK domain protein n=1 Tax=Syphacia muris TaxID=451379 RepID=A0A0N5A7S9_9BILA
IALDTESAGDCADYDTAECQKKQSVCSNALYRDLLTRKCPKTCGFCTETASDTSDNCADVSSAECVDKAYLCTNVLYKDLMQKKCSATCGFCKSSADAATPASGQSSGNIYIKINLKLEGENAAQSSCVDVNPADCAKKSYLCTNAAYKSLMTEKCSKTCNFC